jgi:hypothetical protein
VPADACGVLAVLILSISRPQRDRVVGGAPEAAACARRGRASVAGHAREALRHLRPRPAAGD